MDTFKPFILLAVFLTGAKVVESLNNPVMQKPRRLLLDSDENVFDILNRTQAEIAAMNARLVKLEADMQAEKKERCQTGVAQFHHEECAKSHCSETITVTFNPPFTKIPVLTHGFSELDIQDGPNLRVLAENIQVAATGATMKVSTWADTIVHSSALRWMACPQ